MMGSEPLTLVPEKASLSGAWVAAFLNGVERFSFECLFENVAAESWLNGN
jgi:hypothetical protein